VNINLGEFIKVVLMDTSTDKNEKCPFWQQERATLTFGNPLIFQRKSVCRNWHLPTGLTLAGVAEASQGRSLHLSG
jgi:hypothetical protein